MRVAFIGLGNIGRPMAIRLAKARFEMSVYDIDAAACDAVAEVGARVASSPGDAARDANLIGVCVRDDADVRDVMFGDGDSVFATASAGATIALHSTILPDTVREVARPAAEKGIVTVDAPVTGGAAGAQQGSLTCMVGGAPEAVERCKPVFSAFASNVFHTGPIGSAAVAKLCLSIMTYSGFRAALEAIRLAAVAGLSYEALEQVARESGVMNDNTLAFSRMRRTVDQPVGTATISGVVATFAALGEKDLAHVLTLARENGIELPATELGRHLIYETFGAQNTEGR
jgi:3-hydroxyisobutyrate dehydrogenase-like beta-hydroxyacid dehydrogenase